MSFKSFLSVLFFLGSVLLTSFVDSQVPYIAGGLPAANGNLTHPGEFPFMAALGWINKNKDMEFPCGGMLISSRMVLTAAHCACKDDKIPDVVYLGGNPLGEYTPFGNSTYLVNYAIIYPDYNSNQAYHDIALLVISNQYQGAKFEGFRPICLWRSEDLPTKNSTAIGYGLMEFAGRSSKQLLKVDLEVFPTDFCESFYKGQKQFNIGISNAHICAGDKKEVKDTCQGDSGGPLIIKHKRENYAVGITSAGQACSGFPPAIYAQIFPYLQWITQILDDHGEKLKSCDENNRL